MPIYEYKCNKCGSLFDVLQSIGASNENLNCPSCGEPKPDRIFSTFGSGSTLLAGAAASSAGCSSSSPFS